MRYGYEEFVMMLDFPFISTEVPNGKGDIRGSEWIGVAIARRIGGIFHCVYIHSYLCR